MAGLKIHGSEFTANKLFSDEFAFVIPHFQRSYAWGEEQVGNLVDDLLKALGEDDTAKVESIPPYFLGCIVLIKQEDRSRADVVDGQQRLTTLTILLSALRSELSDRGLADELAQYLFTKGQKTKGTEDHYRLTVRARDKAFFQTYIQQPNGIESIKKLDAKQLDGDSQRRIRQNTLYLIDRLKVLPEMRRQNLAMYLLTRCVLVVVSSPDLDSAYRIFSVLNDRGMNLSAPDILKAEIIGAITDKDSQEAYAVKWEEIEDDLGLKDFEELFSHIRMIYRKQVISSLLGEFRAYILPHATGREFIDKILLPYGDSYRNIKGASFESAANAEAINDKLAWLNRIDNFDWVPPAIHRLTQFKNDSAAILEFLVGLERLAAVMLVIRRTRMQRVNRYAELLKAMEVNTDLAAADSPLQLTADEKLAARHQLSGPIYLLPSDVVRYILLRVDQTLSDGGARYENSVISIEHVLPQSPAENSEWLREFPDAKVRDDLVHTIGNLVLLSRKKNSSAKNFDFAKKKATYFSSAKKTSTFAITSQVLAEASWTPDVVRSRQKMLLEKLSQTWRLT